MPSDAYGTRLAEPVIIDAAPNPAQMALPLVLVGGEREPNVNAVSYPFLPVFVLDHFGWSRGEAPFDSYTFNRCEDAA